MTDVAHPTAHTALKPLDDLTLLAYDAVGFAQRAASDVFDYMRVHGARPTSYSVSDLLRGGILTIRVVDADLTEQIADGLHLSDDRGQVRSSHIGWVRWFEGDFADTRVRLVALADGEHPTLRRATVGDAVTISAVLGGVTL